MTGRARHVLVALQATVLALPLFLGGRQPAALAAAWTVTTALLWLTIHERRRAGHPSVPGAWALAAFVGLGLLTTVPLPPGLIERLAPATAALYRDVLPGWPGGGGWSAWRTLAWDPYAVWTTLSTLVVGLGAYVVVVGYPWGDAPVRARVFGRLVLTVLAGGVLLALFALVQQVFGNGFVGWLSDEPVIAARVSGPFVNPNHLAYWLELLIPVGVAYAWVITARLWRDVRRSADAGRSLGLKTRRAWVSALVVNQRRLAPPFLVLAGVLVMAAAHAGAESRGGRAALAIGLAVTLAGLVRTAARRGAGAWARWASVGVLGAGAVAGGLAVLLWAGVDEVARDGGQSLEASFAARLAVGVQGLGIVRDHLLLGTGLGTWLHAFRPYAEPPVGSLIWDYAHDDYLQLAAETGLAGLAIVALFSVALVRAMRKGRVATARDEARSGRRRHDGFELPDWQAALGERSALGWGLAGGVAAVLVHSAVDFGLHLPGNFLLFMVVLGMIVLALPPQDEDHASPAPFAFAALAFVAALPVAWNAALVASGRPPLSPETALALADLALAEDSDATRAEALVRRAIDRAPASRDAHEQLATVLGPGPAGDEALRRTLRLEPWSAPIRDALALNLWDRGERAAALVELEESFARYPTFAWHAFLTPVAGGRTEGTADVVRALALGDVMAVRLSGLDPAMAAAIERGFDRALESPPAGADRQQIVADRVALLEAHARWRDAADALLDEAARDDLDDRSLGHAARNYLRAGDPVRAERALLAALERNPERGSLYKRLAVEIYGARGDFGQAEQVLAAGERNAVDLLPVYDASAAVIAKREQEWKERMASGRREEETR